MENTRISHYEITKLLGRGGMGEVYEAMDLDLGRRVALKFIAPELAAEPEAFRRFEREARLAASLNHPHIATLYAFERADGRPFIAMELMSGKSLRARVSRGPMPVAEALGIARDLASALAHAHGRDIIHRDIKPENLMFDLEGVAKVTDFGLAKAAAASRLTMTGTSLGTAAYMAPESVHGGGGKPSDVFALGTMLHEMLAGTLPFAGESPLALMYAIANKDPVPIRSVRPEVSEEIEALIQRLLVKNPDERPTAATAARELAALSGHALTAAELRGFDGGSEALQKKHQTEELPVERVPAQVPAVPDDGHPLQRVSGPVFRFRVPRWLLFIFIGVPALWLALGVIVPQVIARNHEQAVTLTNQGVDSLQSGNLHAAQRLFDSALRKNPRFGNAMVNLGRVALDRGDDNLAAQQYARALDVARHDSHVAANAHFGLGEIDMRAAAWPGAVDHLQKALALDSSSAAFYNNLGYALIMSGRPTDGVNVLIRGIEAFPGEARLHKNLALGELKNGDRKSAIQELDRALELDPSLSSAMGLMAQAKAEAGDFAGAKNAWDRYLAMHPDEKERPQFEAALRARRILPP